MSVPRPAELLAFLQEHKLLTPSQAQQFDGGNLTQFADGRVFARELVGRNWLTAYQANQLLQGHGEDLLLGPYRLLDRLGEGGMGQVFKAHHVSMDRLVALKIIPKDRVSNPVALGRFYREVRAVAKLSHPNIVVAFEVNQVGETHFLAMEYVNGIDLARLVQQSGPLPIANACEYIRQAAVGLQHAHEKGLVHRDIKPGNLMVARPDPDEPPVIKILDFGLARFESESNPTERLTQLGKIVGTVDYIAPEQAQNARTADIRADLYSLGCSLFYLLTASPPFLGDDDAEKIGARILEDAPSVRKSRPEVPPDLERIVAKMVARNPSDRYQTPGEVAEALKPHTRDKRQARSSAAPTSGRSIAHTAERQTAASVTSESPFVQTTDNTVSGGKQLPAARPPSVSATPALIGPHFDSPRSAGEYGKGHGKRTVALIGTGVIFLCCLGLGLSILLSFGDKPTLPGHVVKGETNTKTAERIKPITKADDDTHPVESSPSWADAQLPVREDKKAPSSGDTSRAGDLAAIQTRLTRAKEVYKAAVERARASLLRRFEELIRGFAADGNTKVVSQLKEEMNHFESRSILFGRQPELKEAELEYGQSLKRAREALASSYEDAIGEYKRLRESEKVVKLKAESNRLGLNAPLVSVQGYLRNTYIQHADYLGWLEQLRSDSGRLNATFELVPGLADANCVSFRSVNIPDHYLVHGDFRIRLQLFEDSDGYRKNGTFRRIKGLGAATAYSFESVNYPGHYIRAKGTALFIEKDDGTPQFRSDATFTIVGPQFKLW